MSESEESPANDKSNGSVDTKNSSKKKSSALKDTILLDGCDLKHWLIIMDFSKAPKPSDEEIVNSYVKTLAQVVGSEEEAKKKIYSVATETYTGFGVEISEELSTKVKGLVSDAFHLTFGCGLLTFSLFFMATSRKKADGDYTYG